MGPGDARVPGEPSERRVDARTVRGGALRQDVHPKEKLAHYLLDLSKGQLITFSLPMGQQELADYFGVTRSSLARVFADMEHDGLVAFDRRKVTLLDREGLVKIIR